MKCCTIVNIVDADVCTVSLSALNRYLRKYEKQARELLKRTKMKHVLYGIMHDAGSDNASCHVLKLRPCTDEYLRRCFPASNTSKTPLTVSRK
mgnify:CR=1 FL=1